MSRNTPSHIHLFEPPRPRTKNAADTVYILVVEDSGSDRTILHDVFGRFGSKYRLFFVTSGHDAVAFCNHVGQYLSKPRPDFILLDLNMDELSGFETLPLLQQSPGSKDAPIFLLTSSSDPSDIEAARRLGAAGFITKPSYIEEYDELISALAHFCGVL